MATKDNWGWRARIGLFIVGNEAVPEAEWWAMAPSGVSIHAARVTARAPWARWREDRKGVEPEEDLIRGCRQFAAMRLSAVVVGHSSSSILGGKGWDTATVASLSGMLGAGWSFLLGSDVDGKLASYAPSTPDSVSAVLVESNGTALSLYPAGFDTTGLRKDLQKVIR